MVRFTLMQETLIEWQCVHNEVFNTSCWFSEGFFNSLRDVRVEQFWQNIESWGRDERFRYDFPLRVNVERLLKTCFNFMRERIRRQPQNKNDPSCRTKELQE